MPVPAWPSAPGLSGAVPGMAWFSLHGLPEPPLAYLPRLRPAGFLVLETAEFTNPDHVVAVRDAGLRLGAAVTGIADPAVILPTAQAAASAGADYIRMKVLSAWSSESTVAIALDAVERAIAATGIPIHVETHRSTASQDLFRWSSHLRQRPSLRLTLDVSHYRITGDWPMPASEPDHAAAQRLVLERTSGLHLRISDGERIQVPMRQAGGLIPAHRALWQDAFARWREQAPGNAYFPMITELLRPPFAPVDDAGAEIGDRWAESLALRDAVLA